MRSGQLDRRITLYRRTEGKDSAGQPVDEWQKLGNVWASWNPVRGSRRWQAQQHVERAAGYFEIRWRPGILPVDEVEYDGMRFKVEGVPEEVGRRVGLRLHVSARYQSDGCQ